MRQWLRATRDLQCGYCCGPIPQGEPVLRITHPERGSLSAFLRCPKCAGEPVPDLPPFMRPEPIQPARRASWGRFDPASLSRDYKRAAGGDE